VFEFQFDIGLVPDFPNVRMRPTQDLFLKFNYIKNAANYQGQINFFYFQAESIRWPESVKILITGCDVPKRTEETTQKLG
jgi:hypothetical protein